MGLSDLTAADRVAIRGSMLELAYEVIPNYAPCQFHRQLIEDLTWFRDELLAGKLPQLMVLAPPRHGKSAHSAILLPVDIIGRAPWLTVMIISASDKLASDTFSRTARDVVRQPWFHDVFGVTVRSDQSSIHEWRTKQGGGMVALGLDGSAIGKGADILILDDLYKNEQQAYSDRHRDTVWSRLQTFYDRVEADGGVISVMHHWHGDDTPSRLLQEAERGNTPPWRVVRYPAIAIEDEAWRKEGAPLWPERWPLEKLDLKRRRAGPAGWAARFQQEPEAVGGDYFQREKILTYDPVYEDGRLVGVRGPIGADVLYLATAEHIGCTWDLARSKTALSDDCGGEVWATWASGDIQVLLDGWTGKVDYASSIDQIELLAATWPGSEIVIESMAWGPAAKQTLIERGHRRVHLWDPQRWGSKEQRASIAAGYVRAGRIWTPAEDRRHRPWLSEALKQWTKFPEPGHKDEHVDCMSMNVVWTTRIAVTGGGNPGPEPGPPLMPREMRW